MRAEGPEQAQTVVSLRRKDAAEEDSEIIAVLSLSFELGVTAAAVQVVIDSALPGDPAERVADVLDQIDDHWVGHFDWPVVIDTGLRTGELTLAFRAALADAIANRSRARSPRDGSAEDRSDAWPGSADSAP